MTEHEWLSCGDPERMLDFLEGKLSERKSRLLAVACCRRIWNLLPNDGARMLVEVGEEYADGLATGKDWGRAKDVYDEWWHRPHTFTDFHSYAIKAMEYASEFSSNSTPYTLAWSASQQAARAVGEATSSGDRQTKESARNAELAAQCLLLRDIFGNAFRVVDIDPSWLTKNRKAVAKLAKEIYKYGDFHRMPELAEALVNAGCSEQDILKHFGPGTVHVKGCWVLDLLLGKE